MPTEFAHDDTTVELRLKAPGIGELTVSRPLTELVPAASSDATD
ncbi:MAG: hypothetical protein ACLFTP_12345 [Rhodosalinus sp.]